MLTQVGKRIGEIRKNHNLSRAQFGKMIGVSGQYIGMVERGKQGVSVDTISKICCITGVSADYVLFGIVDPTQDAATIAALSGLSHEQLQIALDILKRVAQLINTEGGNEALIREVEHQLHTCAKDH